MTHGKAYVVFELGGARYEYDGGLPDEVINQSAHLFDQDGFWKAGYPDSLDAEAKEERDSLPSALWEIHQVGGTVINIHGARPSGAVLEEDWKHPRIY
jgi:hypothetical protein